MNERILLVIFISFPSYSYIDAGIYDITVCDPSGSRCPASTRYKNTQHYKSVTDLPTLSRAIYSVYHFEHITTRHFMTV